MNSRIASLALALHAFLASSPARADGLDPSDHPTQHIAASAAIVTGTYAYLRHKGWARWEAVMTSMAVSLTLGYAKENTDAALTPADNAANVVGTTGAGAFVLTVDLIAF